MMSIFYSLLILSILVSESDSSCSGLNYCNGHGSCQPDSTCECYPGWGAATDITLYRAPDCSSVTCPSGKAWADIPLNEYKAHSLSECSGRGLCDRVLGVCNCVGSQYTGPACERTSCFNDCSGHGRCTSMKNLAKTVEALPFSLNSEYESRNNLTAWDSDKIYGCVCDSSWSVGYGAGETQTPEWFGPDCSLRHCPSGDDPMTAMIETNCTGHITYPTGDVNNGFNGTAGNLCQIDCANRGICDYSSGLCKCFTGFGGSNCAASQTYYVRTDGTAVAADPDPDLGLFTHLII